MYKEKPIIGIPLRYEYIDDNRPILYLGEKVRRTIQKANALVYPICPVQDLNYADTKGNEFPPLTLEEKCEIDQMLNKCDGIFFPGGKKFTPYDRFLLEKAIEKNMPVLGVCLGMQMMSCYKQEISLQRNKTDFHNQEKDDSCLQHKIIIDENSKLYKIIGTKEILVNSFHNMHAMENQIYKTVAKSDDGIIEAIEYPNANFNIGVQWHPEISYDFDEPSRKIIDTFINESIKYKKRQDMIFSKEKTLMGEY